MCPRARVPPEVVGMRAAHPDIQQLIEISTSHLTYPPYPEREEGGIEVGGVEPRHSSRVVLANASQYNSGFLSEL